MTRPREGESESGPGDQASPPEGSPRDGPSGVLGDDRAASEVLGAILLFGILMAVLIALQVTAVPAFNQGVEYEHNQRVQGQLDLLRTDLLLTGTTGDGTSIGIQLGTDYPNRPFLLNPPAATGTIRTGPPGAVTIANASAAGEVGDAWTGGPRRFVTRPVVYTPDYNEYGNAPTTRIENSVLVNEFRSATVVRSGETLVDGRSVSLVLVNGTLSRTGTVRRSLDLHPASGPARTVTVRNDTAPVVVTVPTAIPEAKWREMLSEELVANGGHVTDLRYRTGDPYNELSIVLEPGVTYELTLSKVGLGDERDRPGPYYVTPVQADATNLPAGGTTRLVYEVRDRYDNPVSGVTVDAAVAGGEGTVTAVDATTGTDGRAVFTYTAPGNDTTARVEATIADPPEPREAASVTVNVFDTVRSEDFLDMGRSSGVILADVPSTSQNVAQVTFENVGSSDRTVVGVRFVTYYDAAVASPNAPAEVLRIDGGTAIRSGGTTTTLNAPITLPAGTSTTLSFAFSNEAGADASSIQNSDFAFVAFRFANGDRSVYLIQFNAK